MPVDWREEMFWIVPISDLPQVTQNGIKTPHNVTEKIYGKVFDCSAEQFAEIVFDERNHSIRVLSILSEDQKLEEKRRKARDFNRITRLYEKTLCPNYGLSGKKSFEEKLAILDGISVRELMPLVNEDFYLKPRYPSGDIRYFAVKSDITSLKQAFIKLIKESGVLYT